MITKSELTEIRFLCASGECVDGAGGDIEGLLDKVHGRLIYDILTTCDFRDEGQPASREADLGPVPYKRLGGGIEGTGNGAEILESRSGAFLCPTGWWPG
jgi:hypothetical protein